MTAAADAAPEDMAAPVAPAAAAVVGIEGRQMTVQGVVQGVGFRPSVVRLAGEHGVTGAVRNSGTRVDIEAHGTPQALAAFETAVRRLRRGGIRIDCLRVEALGADSDVGAPPKSFAIEPSSAGAPALGVSPDWVTCAACLAETMDPFSRRYRYPFTACSECGPRLSVFCRPPYDRCNTAMADFPLCADCTKEYSQISDRRFHAQAMACYVCGPKATLSRLDGRTFALDALSFLDETDAGTSLLGKGEVLLIKGLGGYQLACDATQSGAVARLRQIKQREAKPFALLFKDLDQVNQWCELDDAEAGAADALASATLSSLAPGAEAMTATIAALTSPAGPIVLLPRRVALAPGLAPLAAEVAPALNLIGVMLPSTAMHHLLMRRRRAPIVMTSGNLSDEPQAITLAGASVRLADPNARTDSAVNYVLDHNRTIERRVDDSVGRVIAQQFRVMRRARGYAPAPLPVPPGFDTSRTVLAMGGDLKNTFTLLRDGQAVVSQHMGDLHNAACLADQQQALADYLQFYDFEPDWVACDRHPGYVATQMAETHYYSRLVKVGHHHAHIAACLGEHGWPLDAGPVIGIALDGLGMGDNGQLWGGEFLLCDYRSAKRVGTLKPIALLGGDLAAREPWRNLYAQIMAEMGWVRFAMNYNELPLFDFLNAKPHGVLNAMMGKPELAPLCSSAGRLFDAVAAAIGVCRERTAFEGEAAMQMEALITHDDLAEDSELDYPFSIPRLDKGKGLPYIEPLGMWQALLGDLILKTPPARMAARFHRGFAQVVVRMAVQLAEEHDLRTVALGGGVFQNRVLTELVVTGLEGNGFKVLLPREVPVNDGGLSWGQALVALAQQSKS